MDPGIGGGLSEIPHPYLPEIAGQSSRPSTRDLFTDKESLFSVVRTDWFAFRLCLLDVRQSTHARAPQRGDYVKIA